MGGRDRCPLLSQALWQGVGSAEQQDLNQRFNPMPPTARPTDSFWTCVSSCVTCWWPSSYVTDPVLNEFSLGRARPPQPLTLPNTKSSLKGNLFYRKKKTSRQTSENQESITTRQPHLVPRKGGTTQLSLLAQLGTQGGQPSHGHGWAASPICSSTAAYKEASAARAGVARGWLSDEAHSSLLSMRLCNKPWPSHEQREESKLVPLSTCDCHLCAQAPGGPRRTHNHYSLAIASLGWRGFPGDDARASPLISQVQSRAQHQACRQGALSNWFLKNCAEQFGDGRGQVCIWVKTNSCSMRITTASVRSNSLRTLSWPLWEPARGLFPVVSNFLLWHPGNPGGEIVSLPSAGSTIFWCATVLGMASFLPKEAQQLLYKRRKERPVAGTLRTVLMKAWCQPNRMQYSVPRPASASPAQAGVINSVSLAPCAQQSLLHWPANQMLQADGTLPLVFDILSPSWSPK